MCACHQQDLLQRQHYRFHVPHSRAAFTFLPLTRKSRQSNRSLAVVQASSRTATATSNMHMPKSKSKSLPFFTNDLDDSPPDSASEFALLKPFSNATYRALQVRQGEGCLLRDCFPCITCMTLTRCQYDGCMQKCSVSKSFLVPNVTFVAATGYRAWHALW